MTRTRRLAAAYIALAAAVAVLFALNLFWGSVSLAPGAVLTALLGKGGDALAGNIILQLRLPRAVMAALLGAALSAAGYLLQTFFANPIAGPFVMGVSSGAKLAVALTMVVFLDRGMLTSSATMIAAAFAGAMAAMAFVLAVARRVQRMSILVICGVMIGYICSAVTDIVVAFAQDSNIVNLHNWSQGSFSGMTWANVQAAALVTLPVLAAAFLLSKPMAAYQMGEEYARSVGVNVRLFSAVLVLLSSLLAACVAAFAGPISFVGIAVPHLVKQLLGSAKPLHVLPGCCLGGAAFCLFCDLLARMEWIKLYGILLGREEQAEQVFSAQETAVQPILSQKPTGKSCAFFSLTTNNLATVRKGSDYVARMIEMAGGSYVFADLTDNGNSLATMNLPLEDFYAGAKDADVLIYNSAIEGMIASVSQLTERFPLLNEFKAVQNGQVWCTTQSLFQQSMELADLIVDMNRVFTEGTPAAGELKFLTHVD